MRKTETFKLRIERPLLIELFDATRREQERRIPRWESVAGLIRYAVRKLLGAK